MKTVCFFNTMKSWGGGEKWHAETANLLAANGFKVWIATSKDAELLTKLSNEVHVKNFDIGNLSFLNPIKKTAVENFFKTENIETVVFNLSRDIKIGVPAARAAGIQQIIYRRGSAIPIRNSFMNRHMFQMLTGLIANSAATKQTLLKNNNRLIDEDKISVIYNGLDIEGLDKKPFNSVYAKKQDEIVLGSIGRLAPEKNHKFLLDVLKELQNDGRKYKLIIAGSGELEEELKNYANSLGLNEQVLFPGFLNNVKDLLAVTDIFLLPSLWEGFGYVVAEASALGKPVVAFNVASLPELVLDGKTGFLTTPNDIKAFKKAILKLAEDKMLREQMGAAGREFALHNFSKHIIDQKLLTYFA